MTDAERTAGFTELDFEAHQFYTYNMHLHINITYSQWRGHDLEPTAEGWADFIALMTREGRTYLDPYTQRPPEFTTELPQKGQVRYARPGDCDDDGKITTSTSQNIFAYQYFMHETVYCYTNIGGPRPLKS